MGSAKSEVVWKPSRAAGARDRAPGGGSGAKPLKRNAFYILCVQRKPQIFPITDNLAVDEIKMIKNRCRDLWFATQFLQSNTAKSQLFFSELLPYTIIDGFACVLYRTNKHIFLLAIRPNYGLALQQSRHHQLCS